MSTQVATLESFQVVTFALLDNQKKEEYAIPIEQVKEIRAVESITKVPKAKSFVKGIMNLRGQIIPVIDVKEKLELSSDGKINTAKQRILVAEVNNSLTGLLVDEVDEVVRLQTKDVEHAPQSMLESHNYINGIAKVNENLIVLLDVVRLLEDSSEAVSQALEERA